MRKIMVMMMGLVMCAANATTFYVGPSGNHGDGKSWETAKRSIQTAVDIARDGDEIVVSNGVYTSFKVEGKTVTIRSVNGAEHTIVDGGKRNTCAHFVGGIATNSVLTGVTLRNGFSPLAGGGVKGGTLYDCILTGNEATGHGGGAMNSTLNNCMLEGNKASNGGGTGSSTLNNCALVGNTATHGGGAIHSTLNNCVLIGNKAVLGGGLHGNTKGSTDILNHCVLVGNMANYGGGTYGGILNNCVLTGNTVTKKVTAPYWGQGGGSAEGRLNNCIVWGNTAWRGDNHYDCTFNYSCTTPLPDKGTNNITDDPMFVDAANGFFQLQRYSPCINKGSNEYVNGDCDLDGNPRIQNGTVDMGAYEYVDTSEQDGTNTDAQVNAIKPPVRIIVPQSTKFQPQGPAPARGTSQR